MNTLLSIKNIVNFLIISRFFVKNDFTFLKFRVII